MENLHLILKLESVNYMHFFRKIYLFIVLICLTTFIIYGNINKVWIWKYEIDTSNLVSFPKTIMANKCSDLKFVEEDRCVVIGKRLYTKRKKDETPFQYIVTNQIDFISIILVAISILSGIGFISTFFLKVSKN